MLKKTTRGMTAGMTRRGVGFAVAGGGAGYDTDAQAYITAVEAADSQSLETGVKDAINAFVVGCKSDGIWDAIKASCIMAGARTLDGALVPLVGTAPTNNNFVSGDYDRKTGLVGDGATKYLDSNRNNNADPQDDHHWAFYKTQVDTTQNCSFGIFDNTSSPQLWSFHLWSTLVKAFLSNNQTGPAFDGGNNNVTGFYGTSRASSASYTARLNGSDNTVSASSVATQAIPYYVFCRNRVGTGAEVFASSRLSFYSIGEALDLALLDSRVSTLMTAIGAAIP
jgi:hypothetical protein